MTSQTNTMTLNPPVHQRNQRLLSSSVIGEEILGDYQEEKIRYVEVPVVEEVIRHVPRKEIIEVEKRIPKFEVEYVEKVVNVPHVQIIDKHVEVPQVQEVVKHVPKKEIIEVQKQVIRHVPKVETRYVEKIVEVPGEVIQVPKPYLVEQKVIVPRYVDKEVPTVVAQKLVPIISESTDDFIDVELREYNPRLVPVDLFVPRPVNRHLIAAGKKDTHRVVDVPPAQFNALVKQVNPTIREDKALEDILVQVNGSYPVGMATDIVTPLGEEWRQGHVEGRLHYSHDAPVGPSGGQMQVTTQTMSMQQAMAMQGQTLSQGYPQGYQQGKSGYASYSHKTQTTNYPPTTTTSYAHTAQFPASAQMPTGTQAGQLPPGVTVVGNHVYPAQYQPGSYSQTSYSQSYATGPSKPTTAARAFPPGGVTAPQFEEQLA